MVHFVSLVKYYLLHIYAMAFLLMFFGLPSFYHIVRITYICHGRAIAQVVSHWLHICHGHAIAQVVSHWLPTVVAQVHVWAACGVCGGQSGTGAGFLSVLQFPRPIIPPISPSS
jgi:hypothetical protein